MINCRARSYGADVVRRGQPGSTGSGGASPYLRRGILRQPARYLNAYGVYPGMCLAPCSANRPRRRPRSRSRSFNVVGNRRDSRIHRSRGRERR